MRLLLLAALAVTIPVGAWAAPPTEAQAKELVERWVAAQNAGQFGGYRMLCGIGFVGVRRSGAKATTFDRYVETIQEERGEPE